RLLDDWPDMSFPEKTPSKGTTGFLSNAYETLVAFDSKSSVVPYLATKWDVTPTSVVFTLRKDATCADGTPVTPTVVKNSFQNLTDTNSRYLAQLGTPPFTAAADDTAATFTFTIGQGNSDLLYGFADANTGIICPAGLASGAQVATQMYGSGPYVLAEAV